MKKRYFVSTSLFLFSVTGLVAQSGRLVNNVNETYHEQIATVFEQFNTKQASSGILLDAGYNLSPDSSFDGTASCAPSNYLFWKMTYVSLYTSQLANNMADPMSAMAGFVNNTSYANNEIPLGLIDFNVHRLKNDAISNGDAQLINNQLRNVAGRNPFEQLRVLTMSPMLNSVVGNTLSFTLPANHVFTNVAHSNAAWQNMLSSLTIDADDGQGYRTVSLSGGASGNLMSQTFSATYTVPGIKTIKFKIRFVGDNQYYYAKATLNVNFEEVALKVNDYSKIFQLLAHYTAEAK
jgi:hypothetical protein